MHRDDERVPKRTYRTEKRWADHVGVGVQSMASVLVEVSADPQTCRHLDVEELGHNAGTLFIRCVACGSVVIAQSGHRWIIRPTDGHGPLPF